MQTNSMQTCTQIAVLEHNEAFDEKPEREDVDMGVELGVNLINTFSKKHQGQAGAGRPTTLDEINCQFELGADWNDPGTGIKQKMVEFLYAFEKFQIVYDDSYDT